jgi:hypothetical protein
MRVLETVNLASRNKQKRTGLDRMMALAIKEQSLPTSDEVNFVARVGLLGVVTNRGVKLDQERTMRKDRNSKIAGRWWTIGEGLSQTDMDDSCGLFHVALSYY